MTEKLANIQKEMPAKVETQIKEPTAEVLGKVSEMSLQKFGGRDANPNAWHQ